jgi:regulator of replication initiation timing
MAKATAHSVEFEPIDRLEEKLKLLVGMIERVRAERAAVAEENQRLSREIETLRGRLAASETSAQEIALLREERDVIRTRVGEMLEHIEALNL